MSERGPRISLVIPNYDCTDLLREMLESIHESEPITVIVVDDASPDPTVAPCLREFEHAGLIDVLVLRDVNVGMSRTVNEGAALATTPYVCVFANDDLLVPGALGRMANALDRDPDAAFCVGAFEYFGHRTGVRRSAPWDPWRALGRNAWTGSVMVRNDVFLELGGYHDRVVAQDWDLYLTYASRGLHGVVLDEVVYRYRIHGHGGRLSTLSRKRYRQQARTLRRVHHDLYSRERGLRRSSPAGTREKLFWTLMIRIAPYRPAFATEAYFFVGSAMTRAKNRFARPVDTERKPVEAGQR